MPQIPKYVLQAIETRRKAAYMFLSADNVINKYCDREGILNEVNYILTAAETLCEPDAGAEGCIEQINAALQKKAGKA